MSLMGIKGGGIKFRALSCRNKIEKIESERLVFRQIVHPGLMHQNIRLTPAVVTDISPRRGTGDRMTVEKNLDTIGTRSDRPHDKMNPGRMIRKKKLGTDPGRGRSGGDRLPGDLPVSTRVQSVRNGRSRNEPLRLSGGTDCRTVREGPTLCPRIKLVRHPHRKIGHLFRAGLLFRKRQRRADPGFHDIIIPLTDRVIEKATVTVIKIFGRPVMVPEAIPENHPVVQDDGIAESEPGHRRFHIRADLAEGKLGRMNPDDDQPLRSVLPVPAPEDRKRTDTIDTGILPEIDQNDLPRQGRASERGRIEPPVATFQGGKRFAP